LRKEYKTVGVKMLGKPFSSAVAHLAIEKQLDFIAGINSITVELNPYLIVMALSGMTLTLQTYQFDTSTLQMLTQVLQKKVALIAKSPYAVSQQFVIDSLVELAGHVQEILKDGYG
jgi:hypothetical protein